MVEFAVVLPIIVMLFLAIWQCGVAFHKYIVFTDAARVGARKAAVSRTTSRWSRLMVAVAPGACITCSTMG